jgi:hypothetical protein
MNDLQKINDKRNWISGKSQGSGGWLEALQRSFRSVGWQASARAGVEGVNHSITHPRGGRCGESATPAKGNFTRCWRAGRGGFLIRCGCALGLICNDLEGAVTLP